QKEKVEYKDYGVGQWDAEGVRTRHVIKDKKKEEPVLEPAENKEDKPIEKIKVKLEEKPAEKKTNEQNNKKISAKDLPKPKEKLGQMLVSLDLIEPNPDQPRTYFKDTEIAELAKSIRKDGLLQPILVRERKNGKYQIIAGERRFQACVKAKLSEVPVTIKKATDAEAMELAMVENIHRSDLNPIEEAYGYKRIMDKRRITQAELAQMLSKGRSTIANSLRLLDLPEDAQQLLYEEKISAGHARALLAVAREADRQKLTERLVKEKLSVREVENLARLMNMKDEPKSPKKKKIVPDSYKQVVNTLKAMYGTPVRIRETKNKKFIEIEFVNELDLKQIFKIMTE
ncbi:MAG: ParB/RepB/Spo0J family partition protein, partial [Enterococcus sp.]|nr:ParB/RepB/Spo0J family partition protein [Enterococcus sp.]